MHPGSACSSCDEVYRVPVAGPSTRFRAGERAESCRRHFPSDRGSGRLGGMESSSLPGEIREASNRIATEVTALHRSVGRLPEGNERAEMLKALFELTRNVEVLKKQARRLESGDTSRLV